MVVSFQMIFNLFSNLNRFDINLIKNENKIDDFFQIKI
jgi:hypothetical protein